MRSDKPPTPPSASAEAAKISSAPQSLSKVLKQLLTNVNFHLLASFAAIIGGLARTMLIKCEQMICSLGYPSHVAGLASPALSVSSGIQVVYITALYRWKPNRAEVFIKGFPLIAVVGLLIYALVEVPSTSAFGEVATLGQALFLCLLLTSAQKAPFTAFKEEQ